MIQESSLVVSLKICQWAARKHDKKITEEVQKQHNTSEDAGRYNKQLVSKHHLEEISKIAHGARDYHYEKTLPWGENGDRLLPADLYFEYTGEMLKRKGDFEQAVAEFMSNYDNVIAEAKVRLNGMFNPKDYPSKQDMEDKFEFKTSYMPVPTDDFRLHLNDAEIDKLKASVESEITTRMAGAVSDIWKRVKEQLQHMRDRLSTPDAVFRDSLFGNLKELVNLLPKLNITNDQSIHDVCVEMSRLLVEPDVVRNNPSVRHQKAEEVQEVLNKFNTFFN